MIYFAKWLLHKQWLVTLLLVAGLGGCSSADFTNDNKALVSNNLDHSSVLVRENRDWLTDKHAKFRSQIISDVQYQLDFDLTSDAQFRGINHISFNLKQVTQDLTLDFAAGLVHSIELNGKQIDFSYNGFFITIDKSHLVQGAHQLKVKYSHKYSDDGFGLYRYVDKLDGLRYLYTHFEPYKANKLFPSFDQPNIRARFEVKVLAPSHWQVITVTAESQVDDLGKHRRWHFPQSLPISTYIFPLHAGPYSVWKHDFNGLPLRLFARQSVANMVEPQLWFDITTKGLAFFNEYFDYPYPFGKLDQLVVPDFNIGGMENVAGITYTERVLSRTAKTQEQKERLAALVMHEISHMWFGDLVTIDWWSNLWLKESFATYMSNIALEATGLSTNAWDRFYINTKQQAYRADAKVTTHAIQMPVSDTKNGVASFDAITYSKGASVLNQLAHHLGFETFKRGIQVYFKRYQYQATTLPDFMNTLGEVAQQDLTRWTDDWLYKAGTNSIQAQFSCTDDKVSQFTLLQDHPKDRPYLRQHALNIGLYALKQDQPLSVITTQAVKVDGAVTQVPELIGTQCPDMVYPNHSDWGFVKVILDQKTGSRVADAIATIKESMLRAMFYQSLWDMVQSQQLSIVEYVDLVATSIINEPSAKVVILVHGHLSAANGLLNRFALSRYPNKQQVLAKIEKILWQGVERQQSGSELQQIWFDVAIRLTQSQSQQDYLFKLLNGEVTINGLSFDQDKRWSILIQLASFGHPQTQSLLQQERARDPSYIGELSAIAVDASQPDLAVKKRWLAEFAKTEQRLTAQKQKTAMSFLFPSNQTHLSLPFADQLIADLVRFDVDRDQKLITTMVKNIMPRQCNEQSIARLKQAIDNNSQLGLIALKGLKEQHQAEQLCVRLSQ